MKKELNPIIHSQLRLSIMSILAQVEEADFNYLKEETGATPGNISVQLDKLREAGYIEITKSFKGNRPNTSATLTKAGKLAFQEYIESLRSYFDL